MSFYFDNAATTFPKPECVYSFMDSFYRKHGGNAGRGQYKLAAESSKIIFETRGFIQKILCSPNKDVIFMNGDCPAGKTAQRGGRSCSVRFSSRRI